MKHQAHLYAALGWRVFPLHSITDDGECTCGIRGCSDAGKHPRVSKGFKEATSDLDKIDEWFGGNERSNIGIATGQISGITVVDIDIGVGKKGAETWAAIVAEHGEPQTLMAQTGSGGIHLVFKYNSALKTAGNVLGPGIDVRNDGGYIVAAPSRHRSGGEYTWLNWDVKPEALPAFLTGPRKKVKPKKNGSEYNKHWTLDDVQDMLLHVSADSRDMWRAVGIVLGREFGRSDEAWKVYNDWADKWQGKKGSGHDKRMREAFYDISQVGADSELSLGTIVKEALKAGWAPRGGGVPMDSFVYYCPSNNYVYTSTAQFWTAAAVDAACAPLNVSGKLLKASDWLKANRRATSMTCDPLIDEVLTPGMDVVHGELVVSPGAAVCNTYRGSTVELGDARLAQPFLEHVKRCFYKDGDADQFLSYMAHRVQYPGVKPRFALLIAGGQGTGKDTAVEFCVPAIGSWNVASISPREVDATFNEYLACTLVRINEAANMHDMNRWAFNESIKVLIAGSPDYAVINPKYGTKYSVRLHCGVIITTNHAAASIHIPTDDRRYDVIETATLEEMGLSDRDKKRAYFSDLWDWFDKGGREHVAAFLSERDLSAWSSANGQRITEAHERNSEFVDEFFANLIDRLGTPSIIAGAQVVSFAERMGEDVKSIKKRAMYALERLGYTRVKNRTRGDGLFQVDGKYSILYAKKGHVVSMEDVRKLNVVF